MALFTTLLVGCLSSWLEDMGAILTHLKNIWDLCKDIALNVAEMITISNVCQMTIEPDIAVAHLQGWLTDLLDHIQYLNVGNCMQGQVLEGDLHSWFSSLPLLRSKLYVMPSKSNTNID